MSKRDNPEEYYEPEWGKRGPSGKRLGRPARKKPEPEAKVEEEPEKKTRKRRIQDGDVVKRAIMGMAKQGSSIEHIADTLGVSKKWLRQHYLAEIRSGKEIANAVVVENLYQQAMKDAPSAIPAAVYITKARMGWTDKPQDEDKMRPEIVFDFSQLSYEERALLMDRLKEKTRPEPVMIEGEVVDEE